MTTRAWHSGFTLIEVMVALVVMSVLALMSWRGVSGMASAQTLTQARSDEVLQLQTALAQWQTDLDAVTDTQQVTPLEFNGVSLRMTRRDQRGNVFVTAWAVRQSEGRLRWLRWQSVALNTRSELLAAWAQAQRWAQNPGDEERLREVAVTDVDDWEIYYFRNDAWTNPQSADAAGDSPGAAAPGAPGAPVRATVPDGVRMVLKLTPGRSVSGVLTRDWVRPSLGGGKS